MRRGTGAGPAGRRWGETAAGDGETTAAGGTTAGGEVAGGETTAAAREQFRRLEPGQVVYGSSFVNPLVDFSGDVFIGEKSFVAGNTVLDAEEGQSIEIGNATNAQDNVAVGALGRPSAAGNETSLAHHAIVEDSEIGDFAFLGFNSEVRDSTLEDGALVLHGARVENVTIPENRIVGFGQVVTDQATADALPEAPAATEEFRREVLDVNAEFAESYIDLYSEEGESALTGIGPDPETSFNTGTSRPCRRA